MAQQDDPSSDSVRGADQRTRTCTAQHTRGDEPPPSHSVIETVAEATGTAPESMRPLYESIDPDALDSLFAPSAGRARRDPSGYLTFRFEGCDVTVHANGWTAASPSDGEQP